MNGRALLLALVLAGAGTASGLARSADRVPNAGPVSAGPVSAGPVSAALQREYSYWNQRSRPLGYIPPNAEFKARQEAARFAARAAASARSGKALGSPAFRAMGLGSGTWSELGPVGIVQSQGAGLVAGRVQAILVQPSQNRVFAGAAAGGIWRRTLGSGSTFTPVSDFADSLSISCFVADPSNADILYAGTGEPSIATDAFTGAGLLKSIDGGTSWSRVDSGVFTSKKITRVWVDSSNSNHLLASVLFDGLYQSANAGVSWTKILSGGGMDFWVSPSDHNRILFSDTTPAGLATGTLRLSTDAGVSFTAVTAGWTGVGVTVGRIDLAPSPSNPSILWASVAPPASGSDGGKSGIYRSSDGGATWLAAFVGNTQGASWYSNPIATSPSNPDVFFCGGVDIWKGTFGGTLARVTSYQSLNGLPFIHADQHVIAFDPTSASSIFAGNDGGFYFTGNTGSTWSESNGSLGNTQFFHGGVGVNNGINSLLGGTSGNGTVHPTSGTQWTETIAGTGMQCAVDPQQPNVVYGTKSGGVYYISSDSGVTFTQLAAPPFLNGETKPFDTPFAIDPSDGSKVYAGGQRVYQGVSNRSNSVTWTALSPGVLFSGDTVYRIAVAKTNGDVICASAGSQLARTVDGGTTWGFIEPTGGQFITGVAVHPTDANYIVVSRSGLIGQHVMRTTDGGVTWVDLSANLPNVPANNIALNVSGNSVIAYLATDTGVYAADLSAGTISWSIVGAGLPNTSVYDVLLGDNGSTVIAVTHGRGMWRLVPGTSSLMVTSPNGGEVWDLASVHAITWTSNALPGHVKIEISRDGGNTYSTLFADTANDGIESWTVTGPATVQARVRITSLNDGTVVDASDANFTIRQVFKITGTVRLGQQGLSGVSVSANGNVGFTDAGGAYTITGLLPGTYSVSAFKSGYTFSPSSPSVTVGPDAVQNFTASLVGFQITGKVTAGGVGLADVTLSAGGQTATTDSTGSYTLGGLTTGTYTLTAAKQGYQFTPASRSVTVGPNRSGQNFTAVASFTISGTITLGGVGMAGVSVITSGASAVTGVDGTYTLSGLPAGAYTVTVSKTNYRFDPPSANVVVGPDKAGLDFTAQRSFRVTGRITLNDNPLSGVTVQIGDQSAVTQIDGVYTVLGLLPGTYPVVPSRVGYRFGPAERQVTVPSDQANVDFAASSVALLSALTVSNTNPKGGTTITGTVTLTQPASTTIQVTLASSGAEAVVPASVKVLKGKSIAHFKLKIRKVPSSTPVTVTATLDGISRQVNLTIRH